MFVRGGRFLIANAGIDTSLFALSGDTTRLEARYFGASPRLKTRARYLQVQVSDPV